MNSTTAEPNKKRVTLKELLVSGLAQTDALAKLMIEKGLITREEFMQKISQERENEPEFVAQIEFTEWTPDGHLRHSTG